MSDDAAAVEESASDAADDSTASAETNEAAEESETAEDTSESGDNGSERSAESLVEEIIDADEELVEPARELQNRVETLEEENAEQAADIEELTEKLSRARADFKNYKKRTKQKQEEMKARATEDLVERLTKVRDNLVRALDQDEDADIRPGVESTLESFNRALEDENVEFISPEAGDDVDPKRHEVMQRVDSDQPAGTIVDIYQEGYEMAGTVLRPARVTVSDEE